MTSAADLASTLTDQAAAFTEMANLIELRAYAGRVAANLRAIGSGGAELVMAGGDLYRVAQQAYGDAAEWATIARANGLSDPDLDGVQLVLVPPKSANTGGLVQDLAPLDGVTPNRSIAVSEVAGLVAGGFDFTDPANSIFLALI